ncbi:MAG: ABC transporter ATP-binding protein [Dehalococcoidia bacterium]
MATATGTPTELPVSTATIAMTGVSKWYGDKVALSDITFSIGPGVTALLGPNGSGKSTALKLLTGQLRPSRGEVRVLGQPALNNPALYGRMGYVPEQETIYPYLSAREFVEFSAQMHGVKQPGPAAERALRIVDLWQASERRLGGFSKGMRQRVKIAQALVNDPEVLILDEPLTGADPRQRVELMLVFDELAAAGATVLISSHVLAEVERMGSNILVLVDGKLAAEGNFRRIRDLMSDRPRRVLVGCAVAARLLLLPGTCEVRLRDGAIELETTDHRAFSVAVPLAAREAGSRLFSVESLDEGLESVFRYLVE